MSKSTITITLDEYNELKRKTERIDTLERMYERAPYMTDTEIKAVLNICTEKEITK